MRTHLGMTFRSIMALEGSEESCVSLCDRKLGGGGGGGGGGGELNFSKVCDIA